MFSLCCHGWPGTWYVDQAILKLNSSAYLCLLSIGIEGMHHYAQLLDFKKKIYLFYVCECGCLQTHQKRASDPISDGCEPPCDCWELNSGPPEEQLVLLTAERSLQPNQFPFILGKFMRDHNREWMAAFILLFLPRF